MTFTLITAGGTIDKVYGAGLGVRDLHIGDPVAPKILKQMLHVGNFNHFEACRKDSLDVDETDRRVICERILWTTDNHILISHGTDTMVETAQMIKKRLGVSWKRVVLFGASQPASMVESDAAARLGYALCALMTSSEPGVIIAMDGIHTNLDQCQKNEAGIFCSIS
jgi:L-asparaginase